MSARLGIAQGSHKPSRNRRDTAWKDRAACHGMGAEFFFPPPKIRISPEIRRICGGCQVRLECLAYALNYSEDDGIWGGLTEAERKRLKRNRKEATS